LESIDFSKHLSILDILKIKLKNIDTEKLTKILERQNNSHNLLSQLNYHIKSSDHNKKNFKIFNYIAIIPLCIYIESIVKNKVIFQRKQNTILNIKENFMDFSKRTF
jgi:hypothetical protein